MNVRHILERFLDTAMAISANTDNVDAIDKDNEKLLDQTEEQILETKQKGKFVIWKDGTWIYLQNGVSWEFEADAEYLLTIDLNQEETFVDYKDYPGNKSQGGKSGN